MYGMIHQAVRELAVRELGEAAWSSLLQQAGYSAALFISLEYYSDDVTMGLVRTVAARLGMPVEAFLHALGRHWIDFAGASAYGRVLQMAGTDFVSFLDSLDRMHSSIRSNMPRADMPAFERLEAPGPAIHLRYSSRRRGLAPFVQGILTAAAESFGENVSITYRPEGGAIRFVILRTGPHD